MHTLTATCKTINNANKKGHRQVLIRKTSKQVLAFLEFMLKHGYIEQITYFDDHRQGKVVVDLNGRLLKCSSVCPQYHIKHKEIEDWRSRLLPARQFGHLVVTTSKGIMDQTECLKENLGGRIVGFFY
ncbi:ribosomal protein S15a [Binucleata daphniae]